MLSRLCIVLPGSCVSFETHLDANVNGGVGNRDQTAGACLVNCIRDSHCSGVDWTLIDPAGKCFVFGYNAGPPQPKPGVTHFNVIRNASCTGTTRLITSNLRSQSSY